MNRYRVVTIVGGIRDVMPFDTWADALAYALATTSPDGRDEAHIERRLSALSWACEGHQLPGRGWDFLSMSAAR